MYPIDNIYPIYGLCMVFTVYTKSRLNKDLPSVRNINVHSNGIVRLRLNGHNLVRGYTVLARTNHLARGENILILVVHNIIRVDRLRAELGKNLEAANNIELVLGLHGLAASPKTKKRAIKCI